MLCFQNSCNVLFDDNINCHVNFNLHLITGIQYISTQDIQFLLIRRQ